MAQPAEVLCHGIRIPGRYPFGGRAAHAGALRIVHFTPQLQLYFFDFVDHLGADAFRNQRIVERVGIDALHCAHQVLHLAGECRVIPDLLLQAGEVAESVANGAVPVGTVRAPTTGGCSAVGKVVVPIADTFPRPPILTAALRAERASLLTSLSTLLLSAWLSLGLLLSALLLSALLSLPLLAVAAERALLPLAWLPLALLLTLLAALSLLPLLAPLAALALLLA